MRRHSFCTIEALELRRLMSATVPTADEQYMLELINRARANPAAEAAADSIDLNEGLPAGTISAAAKQPLAFNSVLIDAARGHSNWMLSSGLFQHPGPGNTTPLQRDQQAGYMFTPPYAQGENIAWEGTTGTLDANSTTADEHNSLFIDKTEPGRGHRTNIEDGSFKEIGVGIETGKFQGYNALMTTQDFAYTGSASFLTGVAYTDTVKADHFYTPGEGLGGITVTASRASDNAVFSTTTFASGGYTLALAAGTYHVRASGAGLNGTIDAGNVIIGSENVKEDFTPGGSTNPASPKAALASKTLTHSRTYNTFTVTYTGGTPFDTTTFDSHDILVVGPGGSRRIALLVGVLSRSGGNTQTVTYRLRGPSGPWKKADNGSYRVYVRAGQVNDGSAGFVPDGYLGNFRIKIA